MLYVLVVAGAYLVGSIPFAYLAGRLLAGKDLRVVGTGNLGTHNVFHEVGKAAGVAVFFLDCGKMAFTVLAIRLAGAPLAVQSLAALAVIAGHNWSVFTGFRGGRGMTVTLVGAAILLPLETAFILGILGFGVLTRSVALYCGFSLVAWPVLALAFGAPPSLLLFAFGALVLGFARRLQGSPELARASAAAVPVRHVLVSRLLFDREYDPGGEN